MKRSISILCCVLILSATVQTGISEQTAPALINDWTLLTSIQPGTSIAIGTTDGKTLKGKLKSVSDSALFMEQEDKDINLEKSKVSAVWLVKRSMKKSVLIGTAVGAGAGAALGAAIGGCNKGDFICFERKGTIPIGAVVFGALGAVIGLAIGSMHHSKVLVYRIQ